MAYNREKLDALRTNGEFGEDTNNPLLVTPGVADIIDGNIQGLFYEFVKFDEWDSGWDAHNLHEIGVIDYDGHEIMFKITPLDAKEDTYSLTFLLKSEW